MNYIRTSILLNISQRAGSLFAMVNGGPIGTGWMTRKSSIMRSIKLLLFFITITLTSHLQALTVSCANQFTRNPFPNQIATEIDRIRTTLPSFVTDVRWTGEAPKYPDQLRRHLNSIQTQQLESLRSLQQQINADQRPGLRALRRAIGKTIETLRETMREVKNQEPTESSGIWKTPFANLKEDQIRDVKYNLNTRLIRFDSFLLELLVAAKTPGLYGTQMYVHQLEKAPVFKGYLTELSAYNSVRRKEVDVISDYGRTWIEVKTARAKIDEQAFWAQFEKKFEDLAQLRIEAYRDGFPLEMRFVFVVYDFSFIPPSLIEELNSMGYEVALYNPRSLLNIEYLSQ